MKDYMEEYEEAIKEDVCDEQFVITMIDSDIANLQKQYGDDVQFFCPNCNDYVNEFEVSECCPHCKTPKIKLKLVVSDEEYKKYFQKLKDLGLYSSEEENSDFNVMDEFEYYCDNCSNNYTSTLRENVKCPNCNMLHEQPTLNKEDIELDWEPNEEDY